MNGIVILEEYIDGLQKLSREDLGALMQALFTKERGEDPDVTDCSMIVQILFPIIQSSIDRVKKVSEVRSESGKRGGRPGKQTDSNPVANEKQTESKKKQTESKTEANGKQTESPYHTIPYHTIPDIGNKRFTPPTVQDVLDYANEKGLDIDAERFVDFYASKGWKVGSSPMKDWRAACRNWGRDNRKPAKIETPVFNFDQRKTDYDALLSGMGL